MHNIRRIGPYLTEEVAVLTSNALVSNNLDYFTALCSEVCHVSIRKSWRVFLHVLSQIIECMLMLHPSLSDSTGCLSNTAVCSKLQHWFLNIQWFSYLFEPSLSLSSCFYITRRSHPNCQYLTVLAFQSSLYKSIKHFGHSLSFDAPKNWNDS